MKKSPKKPVEIPSLLKEAFIEDEQLFEKFSSLGPSCQREYAEYIAEAKQEKTKLSRLEKCIPMIKEKKGLNDKYKNC